MMFDLSNSWRTTSSPDLPAGVKLELHAKTSRSTGELAGFFAFENGAWQRRDTAEVSGAAWNPLILDEWVYSVEDAIVTSDWQVYAQDGTQLISRDWAIREDNTYDVNDLRENAIRIDGTVAYGDHPVGSIYGHWLLHSMPRVLRLRQIFGDIPAIVPRAPWNNLQHWSVAGLRIDKLMHVPPHSAAGKGALRVERLLLTNHIVLSPGHSVDRLEKVLRQFNFPGTVPDAPQKIFIARKQGATGFRRGMSNSGDVIEVMNDLGFTTIYAQDHHWKDQISLFRGARLIVGETGGGLNTAMLAGPELTVLEITPLSSFDKRQWQRRIGQARNQQYGAILGPQQEMSPGWVANLEALKAGLESIDFVNYG
jgi:hypothetical protein